MRSRSTWFLLCMPLVACVQSSGSDPVGSSRAPLTVGAARQVGDAPLSLPARFYASSYVVEPSAANNGAVTLVTWTDDLAGYSTLWARVRGTRVTSTGTVLDPSGFSIGPLDSAEQYASVPAWNGSTFVVAWRSTGGRLSVATVSSAGVVSAATDVSTTAAGAPDLACQIGDCLLTWVESGDVVAVHLDVAGIPTGAPFGVFTSVTAQGSPQVTVLGSNYLVVWRESTIRGALVSGTISTSIGVIRSAAGVALPDVAAGPADALVVWTEGTDVRATRITAAGTVVDTSPLTISSATNTQTLPHVTWTGADWVVSWEDNRNAATWGFDVYAARVTTAGVVSTGQAIDVGVGDHLRLSTSWTSATTGLAVYVEPGATAVTVDLRGAVLQMNSGGPQVTSVRTLVRYANGQLEPAVAFSNDRYLAVWRDERDGGQVMGARFFNDAGLQDTTPLVFTGAGGFNPRVVRSGTSSFLVTWQEGGRIRSSTVGATGNPAGGSQTNSTSVSSYDIASNGSVTLVVWSDFGTGTKVMASRSLTGSPFVELDSTGGDMIAVAPGPDSAFTVVWRNLGFGLRTALVNASVGFDAGVLTTNVGAMYPRSASVGGRTLYVWHSGSTDQFQGALLTGSTLTPVFSVPADAGSWNLVNEVVSDGQQFVVLVANGALTAHHVDVTGALRDTQTVAPPPPNPDWQATGQLACRAPRDCQVVTREFDTTSGVWNWRLRARPLWVTKVPVAMNQTVTTLEDTPVLVTLVGTDPDGDPLTFSVATTPARGSVSGFAPAVTYTPTANLNGGDSFTFAVNDGVMQSIGTVTVNVTPVNDPPVAVSQSLTVSGTAAVPFTLTATDVDVEPLTFTVVGGPDAGTLTGTPPNLTWQPTGAFGASDVVRFQVSDGTAAAQGTVTFQRGAGGGSAGGAAGGSAGGSTAGGSTAGGSTAGGSTAGGSTAGGSTAGGSTAGGSTAGGSTAGGSTAGGSTAGGSTAGGSAAGGSTAGGSTAGGSTAGGSTAGGSSAGGSTAGGSTAGGSSAGGSTAGGSTAGGSTAGGSTAGGSTAGGSTAGGSTAGGSTAGGSSAGGSTAGAAAGGSIAGGSTAGGSTAGGSTAGGSTAGGSTAGGSTAGGSTAGGSTAGGSAGGSTAGGSTAGGSAGGSAGGGAEPTPGCGCSSGGESAWLALLGGLLLIRAGRIDGRSTRRRSRAT